MPSRPSLDARLPDLAPKAYAQNLMDRLTALMGTFARLPSAAWLALGLAALAIASVVPVSPTAAIFMAMAAAAAYAAWRNALPDTRSQRLADQTGPSLADLAPLLEALPDPALLVNAERRLAGSNAAARKHLEFEAQGQFLTSILRQPDVLEAVQAAVDDGATRAVEYETVIGVERHTRCYVAPVHWGAKSGALLVFHDQTARISTERMRADFLANASHELRTPLASLTLLIETIAGPARDSPEERGRFLLMMQKQAERMRRLIDDLLSLSRIELDEHIPPSDRADLSGVARETNDLLAAVAAERGARIEIEAPARAVRVVGERFQLAQVVQNLVDNAIKYSPQGGAVSVEVGVAGDREEVLLGAGRRWAGASRVSLSTPSAAANRSYAFVRVEDAGPGVDARYLPRLGERFFRVERELGNEKGGTGLGLAIVKHIVNRHRGGLIVESQVGKGSAFVAYFELADEQ